LNPPADVYIYLRKDSNKAGENILPTKGGNLRSYEPVADNVTGLIVGAEYNTQGTHSAVRAMVKTHLKHIAINYTIFVNPFATNVAKTVQIHSLWYEQIARNDPAQRNSQPPHAYISVANNLSQ
jgi:hypothetical protein